MIERNVKRYNDARKMMNKPVDIDQDILILKIAEFCREVDIPLNAKDKKFEFDAFNRIQRTKKNNNLRKKS